MSSQDRARRVGIQVPLGFAAGIPLFLTGTTLTAWATDVGVSMVAVGAMALVKLPYNFKFLWAPLLDRFTLPWLGRRRGWMIVMQLALTLAIFAMGTMNPASMMGKLAIIAVAVAALSASQDIVIDAYRTDMLGDHERGRGAAAYVISYRIALIVTGSGALILSDHVSWQVTYWVMAGLMSTGVIATFLAPRSPAIRPPRDLVAAVVLPFREFFSRRNAILALAIVMSYKFGDALAGHLITPFLMKVGFAKTDIGVLQKALGMAATIAGAAAGGVVADRIGVLRALLIFGVLQTLANVGYAVLAVTGKSYALLVVAVGVDNLCNGLGTAAFVAFLMSLCRRRFSATQYALFTSASSILGRLLGAFSGYVVDGIGWVGFFIVTIVVAIPALVVIGVVRLDSIFPAQDEDRADDDETGEDPADDDRSREHASR